MCIRDRYIVHTRLDSYTVDKRGTHDDHVLDGDDRGYSQTDPNETVAVAAAAAAAVVVVVVVNH